MENKEEVDETFEIISDKERLWRQLLAESEVNYLKSEASVLQNEAMITLCKAEVDKESAKNKV